ncbi:MAG: glucuronate isomerase [Treponema sp.]|jgi:glucuronate isomerase|nr:glucuronate isomerase [Treponema sp.]
MKKFMDRDFLLKNKTALKLYHEAASGEPIFDYHCHLIPKEIADDRRFPDLAYMWLGGDHYKWRALRANGIDEKLITGDADPYDKFLAWAETVPKTIGNPLYHWTHLELQRYFDIYEPLNPASAPAIWKAANDRLKNDPALSVYGIFKKFRVYGVGTTDDPADTLEWHDKTRTGGKTETLVLPSFRPDRVLNIEKPDFVEYIAKLGASAGKNIQNLEDLLDALRNRIAFFDKMGCCISDHGLESIPFETASSDTSTAGYAWAGGSPINEALWEKEVQESFAGALAGKIPGERAAEAWKTYILNFLGGEYYEKGWAMQIHIAAIRSINSRAFKNLGPDTGFDAVHDQKTAAKLSRFLDLLQSRDKLPKTILYSLNLKDLYPMGTIMGAFQGGAPGKIQLGSGWWFLDHIDGMEAQMKLLGNVGLLSRFIGMLTDSRSFLSYPRHEYFRRILCNILGTWAEDGEIPVDLKLLSGMVKDISFGNAKRYFEKQQ